MASYLNSAKLIGLIKAADPNGEMFASVLSSARLAMGKDPLKPTHVIDFSTEAVAPFDPTKFKSDEPVELIASADRVSLSSRRSGSFWFELLGKQRSEFGSLRDLLRGALLEIEKARPGTLDELSQMKPRSKRIVARDPRNLFAKEKMAENFAKPLGEGWFYGTNNSRQETEDWLRRACKCAGLKWGVDFKTNVEPNTESTVEVELDF
jgi:hypothetical protein